MSLLEKIELAALDKQMSLPPIGNPDSDGPDGEISATDQIMAEIRERQGNPLNTVCVDCQGLIYPRSHHLCRERLAEQNREAKPWA